MPKIEILRARAEHIDEIMGIENLSFAIPWSRHSIVEELTVNRFAVYFCAVLEGRVVGYAGMWQVVDEGHVTNIAVHPDHRGNGIGSELLARLLEFAEGEGIQSMTLEVRRGNLEAQGLYRKYGFEEAGLRKGYYSDNGEDALIMWKHGI